MTCIAVYCSNSSSEHSNCFTSFVLE